MAEENDQEQPVDLSALGSFDFAPSWATGDKVVAKGGRGGFRDDDDDRPAREGRGPRRFDGAKGGGRKPFDREDRRGGGKPFDREDRRGGRKPFDRDDRRGGGKPFDRDARKPFNRDSDRRGGSPRREFIKPLDAEVRVLPGQKELGGIIRKIQTGFAAYPLKQIAWFFLDHPEACHVKVTPKDPEMRFHVCKACGASFFTAEALDGHIVAAHLGDYYIAEETEVEPPSGQFGCVVKCGITGEFIGPPNLHGYNAAVRDMAQKLGMDEDEYRARLVTLRDQESVEAWRSGATKKTLYRLKAAVDAAAKSARPESTDGEAAEPAAEVPAVEREQAEAEFRRNIMPQLRSLSKSSDMSLDKALKSTDLPYLFAVRDAIARERRFPASLFFALRGAFHHRKLSFFRANDPRGQEFVCAAKPVPLDVEHAIPELGAVVKFVEEHPLCSIGELPPEMKGHLEWLVEKGHIVKYFNGVLVLPEAHPKFRNLAAKRAGAEEVKQAAERNEAQVAPVEEASAEVAAAPEASVEEVKKEEVANEAADQLAE